MSFHGEPEQYSRNYSHRLYHLEEPDDETAAQCQDAVVKLFHEKIQTQKGSKERLFITARIHNIQIFWEIPFVKPQNDT